MLKKVDVLIGQGKRLRDALTHPSAYADPRSGEQERVALVVTVNLDVVEKLLEPPGTTS